MKQWTELDYQHMLFAQFLQLAGELPEQVDIFFYMVRCGFTPYEAQKMDMGTPEYELCRDGMLYDKIGRSA